MVESREYHSVGELISSPIYVFRIDYSIQVYNMVDGTVVFKQTIHEFVPMNNSHSAEFYQLVDSELQQLALRRGKSTLPAPRPVSYRSLTEDVTGRHPDSAAKRRDRTLDRGHRKPLFSMGSYLSRGRVSVRTDSLDNSSSLFWVGVFVSLAGSLVMAIIAIIYLGLVNLKYMKQEQARSRATSSTVDRTVSLNNSPNCSPFSIHPKELNSCLVNDDAYNGEYPEGDQRDPFALNREELGWTTQLNSEREDEVGDLARRHCSFECDPSQSHCGKEHRALGRDEAAKFCQQRQEEEKKAAAAPDQKKLPEAERPTQKEEARAPDIRPANGARDDQQIKIYSAFERYLEDSKYRTKYEEIKLLGRGGFAEVYVARYIVDGNFYAIKKVPVVLEEGEELKQHHAYREIEAMTRLNHQNIVRYMTCWIEKGGRPFVGEEANATRSGRSVARDALTHTDLKTSELAMEWDRGGEEDCDKDPSESPSHRPRAAVRHKVPLVFYIQMEYCTGSSLADYIANRHDRASSNLKYFQQILSALREIHASGLIHRDIKPANMLIDKSGNLKICDFGLAVYQAPETSADPQSACSIRSELTTKAGTRQYLSPEQLANLPYDEKVDIYSTGLILLELCRFFETMHERFLAFQDLRRKRLLPKELEGKEEGALILRMTEEDPRARPSAAEIMELPAFRAWVLREGLAT